MVFFRSLHLSKELCTSTTLDVTQRFSLGLRQTPCSQAASKPAVLILKALVSSFLESCMIKKASLFCLLREA